MPLVRIDEPLGIHVRQRQGQMLPLHACHVGRWECNALRHGTHVLMGTLHLAIALLISPTVAEMRTEADVDKEIISRVHADPQASESRRCDHVHPSQRGTLVRPIATVLDDDQERGVAGTWGFLRRTRSGPSSAIHPMGFASCLSHTMVGGAPLCRSGSVSSIALSCDGAMCAPSLTSRRPSHAPFPRPPTMSPTSGMGLSPPPRISNTFVSTWQSMCSSPSVGDAFGEKVLALFPTVRASRAGLLPCCSGTRLPGSGRPDPSPRKGVHSRCSSVSLHRPGPDRCASVCV